MGAIERKLFGHLVDLSIDFVLTNREIKY